MARSFQLPFRRILNSAFAERGRPDVVKIECLPIGDGELLRLTFESVASPWRQGVWLSADEGMTINGERCPSAILWQDTAPREVSIRCHTQTGFLLLYNIWDDGRGRQSQLWTSGMLVEELPEGRRYRCNDVGFESDFDRLVFRIERIGGAD